MHAELLRESLHGEEESSFMGDTEESGEGDELSHFGSDEEALGAERVLLPHHASRIQFIINQACLRKGNLRQEEADRIVDHHAREGRLIYYYKCDFCGSIHLTKHQTTPKRKLEVI